MDDFASQRTKMVDSQLRTEAVTDYGILAAMGRVPREMFVPAARKALAYVDSDIALKKSGEPRYLMQAAPFARLLQLAEITPSDSVLIVGTGTGYSAAVVAALARSVVAVESDPDLAMTAKQNLAALNITNARIVVGSLDAGAPGEGPYDVIVVEGAVQKIPASLQAQLKNGGRLVAVVGEGGAATATLCTRSDNEFGQRRSFNAAVPPLPGFRQPATFVF
jgi:protein-L-isoaspartate(D-aspartate) O-methyltransferase